MLIAADDAVLALRFDRATGATWRLKGNAWARIKEPAADKKPAASDKPPPDAGPKPPPDQKPNVPVARTAKGFALRYSASDKVIHIVRFHTSTGAAAHIARDSYETLNENGPVAPGDMGVSVVAAPTGWEAFRIDRSTGASWKLLGGAWFKVTEPE